MKENIYQIVTGTAEEIEPRINRMAAEGYMVQQLSTCFDENVGEIVNTVVLVNQAALMTSITTSTLDAVKKLEDQFGDLGR
jgi:hypothetical protein